MCDPITTARCPVKKALEVIGGKWKLLIVYQINHETRRFGELKRLIPEISEKMLIQDLKALVEMGVLDKKSYGEIPPRVEYTVTEKGKKLLTVIEQIKEFGMDYV